ncbi:MAG TPA: FAD-dependent oxidoreductase [Gemmatimonadales bacterium]
MTVAVVGAGLAGLSAAWELQQAGADAVVLDAGRRPGGMIVTERRDGFVVEGGPDGFLAAEPDIQDLARAVGIGDRLVDQVARGSTLWTGRRLEPLAEGKAAELLGIQVNANVGGFRTFAAGMVEVVEALVARLAPRLRTTQGVTAVAPAQRGWRLSFTGASSLDAEAVILAVPAWVAARLLAGLGVAAARALDTVLYAPSITVSLAYRADQVPGKLEGSGFVAAPDAGGAVRACTYAWRKYPQRAPQGFALLRAFIGPVDGDPAAIAQAELAAIVGIEGAPLWSRAFHWPRGLPRYPRGHAERVAAVRERLAGLAPLAIAGAGFDGAGVSACVKSGREAGRVILARLGARPVRG